jgi:hypothetical protein
MSADIQKESVFDDRIIQSPPRYAVEKGALSLTNAPFNAIAATASQQTFNIYVPSENVFVDRALRWSGTAYFGIQVLASQAWLNAYAPYDYTTPILTYGTDVALSPLPLNYLCQTMTATINDTTSVINSQDVLMEVMRLTNYKKNLLQRTCPTMMDKYQWNGTALRCVNDPMAGFAEAMNVDEQPNGAFGGFFWTDSTGTPLSSLGTFSVATGQTRGSYTAQNSAGDSVVVNFANGVPCVVGGPAATEDVQFPLFFAFRSTEKLVLSPFVFADDQEDDTGLFGINNIQLIMNFKSGAALQRLLRTRSNGSPTAPVASGSPPPTGQSPLVIPGSLNWNNNATGGVWAASVMNVQFLTPSLDVPLPPKSVVPYMEFPRYITQQQNGIAQPGVIQLQSQTITLPQIPDLLLIYVKASQATGYPDPQSSEYGDCYMPVANSFNSSIKNPLSVNFDNFSGLLSSHTAEELYQMSVSNGLQMPWNVWCGLAYSENAVPAGQITYTARSGGSTVSAPANPYQMAGQLRSTVGGFLVLKPSKDITLQPGQAPSLVGNFTLQFNLSVVNTFGYPVTPTLYVITANSGFFESIRGSSRIIKGVLSEQDIISAPMASAQTRSGLRRLVGGMSFDSLSNIFSRAKNVYDQTKPVVSAIKNALPSDGTMGKVKSAMGAVGYGTGAGMLGESGHGRRKGLSARLL